MIYIVNMTQQSKPCDQYDNTIK